MQNYKLHVKQQITRITENYTHNGKLHVKQQITHITKNASE